MHRTAPASRLALERALNNRAATSELKHAHPPDGKSPSHETFPMLASCRTRATSTTACSGRASTHRACTRSAPKVLLPLPCLPRCSPEHTSVSVPRHSLTAGHRGSHLPVWSKSGMPASSIVRTINELQSTRASQLCTAQTNCSAWGMGGWPSPSPSGSRGRLSLEGTLG